MIDLTGKIRELLHIPRKTRLTYYVDGTTGIDANTGRSTEDPLATVGAAVTAAAAGDRIITSEDTYDEAISVPAGLAGLEIICEPGTIFVNTAAATVVSIAAPDVKLKGCRIAQAGQIGLAVTGAHFLGEDIKIVGCTTSFDMDGDNPVLKNCISLLHTVTGFDISEDSGVYNNCLAVGTAATRGFYLSHTNAENNTLAYCHTLNCTAAGYETVAGADENLFSFCSQSSLCAGPTDAGANNTWASHVEDSQITAGNTLQDDLAALETLVDGVETSQGRMLFTMDFWSDPVEEKAVTAAQVTAAVGAAVVVADLPAGATIVRAIVMMKFRMVENTNAAENSLDCTAVQPIQVDDSGNTGWVTAIDFVDEQFKIAATTREGGDVLIGDNDVAARVDGNDTYDFQWLNAKAHLANIQFNDIQMGIRIWYSV